MLAFNDFIEQSVMGGLGGGLLAYLYRELCIVDLIQTECRVADRVFTGCTDGNAGCGTICRIVDGGDSIVCCCFSRPETSFRLRCIAE